MEHTSENLQTILSRPAPETMGALISKMESVQRAVGRAGIGYAEPFQRVYTRLTTHVNDRITEMPDPQSDVPYPQKAPFFKEAGSLQKTAKIFARFWFDPLEDHLTGRKEPVRAWQPLLMDDRAKDASPGIQFLLGMSAHIIYDLPQALLESKPEDAYYDDFLAVDDLIRETAKEMSQDLISIRHPKRKAAVIWLTTVGIKRWRARSWKDFKTLQAYEESGDEVGQAQLIDKLERRTLRTSNMLLRLGDTAIRAADRTPSLYFL